MGTEEVGLKDPKEQMEELVKENEQLREMNCILEMEREGRSTIDADLYRQDSEEKLKKHLKKYKALVKTMRKLLADFDLEGDDDQEGDEGTGEETAEKKDGGSDDPEMQNLGGGGGGDPVPPPAGGDDTDSNVEDMDGGVEQSSSKEGGGEEVEVKNKEEAISPDITVPATPSSSSSLKKLTPGTKNRRRSKKGDALAQILKADETSQLDLSSPGGESSEPNSEGLDASASLGEEQGQAQGMGIAGGSGGGGGGEVMASSEYKRKFGIFGESLLTADVALRENDERLRNQAPALYSALTASGSTSALGILGFNPTIPTPAATATPTPKKRGRKRKTPAKGAADADQLNASEGNDSAANGMWTPGPSTSTMTLPASNLSIPAPNVVAMCKDVASPATAIPKRRGRKRKTSVPTPTPAKDESAPAHSGGSDPTPVDGSNDNEQAEASHKKTIDGLVNFQNELKKEGDRDRDDNDAAGTGE